MRTTYFVACLALAVLIPSTRVAAQSAQDKAIAQEIGGQLKTSGQLHDYRIGVKYKDGVAALSGTVTDQQQLITAVRLTQQMGNVNQVVNNLTIAGNTQSSSPSQQMAMRAAYSRSRSTVPASSAGLVSAESVESRMNGASESGLHGSAASDGSAPADATAASDDGQSDASAASQWHADADGRPAAGATGHGPAAADASDAGRLQLRSGRPGRRIWR